MTDPLKPETPIQIGSVVGIDRMDVIDRAKQHPRTKLELLAIETKNITGQDPRGGGYAFVARPRVVLQLMLDLNIRSALQTDIRLHQAVVIGERDADIIGWWMDVPILVRCTVSSDKLFCVRRDQIPPSSMIDRQTAGRIRMGAHYGKLETLRDDPQ